jgi:hypothetical protein
MTNVIDIVTGKPVKKLPTITPVDMRIAHLLAEHVCLCGWRDIIGPSLCDECPNKPVDTE